MEEVIYVVDVWGEPVGAGATAPQYCSLGGVCKRNTEQQPYVIANELICGRLGLMIGVPVPPGAIVRGENEGELAHVCLRFGQKGERPPPAALDELVEDCPSEAAGVVAFDCWIANDDRHPENIAFVRGTLPVVAYDHSHALLGPTEGPGRLADHDRTLAGSQIGSYITDDSHLVDWADRISGISDAAIEALCMRTVLEGAIDQAEAEAVRDFLANRKGRIMDLLRASTQALPNVQWGLPAT